MKIVSFSEARNNLKVVTNNLHVASILSAREDFTIIIAGGEVRNRDGGIVGEATRDFINQFRMDFGIIGINDINPTSAAAPFGGMKASGMGREGAQEGIAEYLETKTAGLVV